ncbi:acyl carrier protein [Streptomyces shenzhenensis]|uniref:acyl carrier protein n=1 Tax=Streptomyces shenzhenensis TaxID=943815 RepID=UPI003D8FB9A8
MTAHPALAQPAFDTHLFDCVQVNLAAVAERWHGPGTGSRLGALLRFAPSPGPDGLPTVESSPPVQFELAERALGLVVRPARHVRIEDLTPGEGCFVLADAHHLPWVPYHGRQHIEHSFLLVARDTETFTVEDHYDNETPWGSARPGTWRLSRDLLPGLPDCTLAVQLSPGTLPKDPGPRLERAADPQTYARAYAEHPDRAAALRQLTLETWLLARSRGLHAAYLARRGRAEPRVADQVAAWRALAEQAFLASRRVARGRPEPGGLTDRLARLLRADTDVFGGPSAGPEPAAAPTGHGAEADRRAVAATVAGVLGTDPSALLSGTRLPDVPGFSSFRLAELIDRLEDELGIEFDGDDLTPENFQDVDAVCRIARWPARLGAPADAAAREEA